LFSDYTQESIFRTTVGKR